MPNYPEIPKILELISNAQHIVIIQADNPDGDSVGSALALESLLSEQGKSVTLYCAVDVPSYLKYLPGWDRISREMPKQFDLSIIVDASTKTLLGKLTDSGELAWVASKPCIVLDHHAEVANQIDFATLSINDAGRASTGELIYFICQQTGWPVSKSIAELLMTTILGDTQGLTNSLASAETYTVMAELIGAGADRPALEETRREFSRMNEKIYRYKGELIGRTRLELDGRLASVTIPQAEINEYSPLYNPAALIQFDMLQIDSVQVAVVFKQYTDGRITGAIRANAKYPVAAELAKRLGGGGHNFASGFKVTDGRTLEDIKHTCVEAAMELLAPYNER